MLSVICCLPLVGCHKKNDRDETDKVPVVDVAVPEIDSVVLHKQLPGSLQAGDLVEVVARVDGTLVKKHYVSGTHVDKGQVLFTIESTKYGDLLRQAEAQLATAQSQYELYSSQYEARSKAMASGAVSQMDVLSAKSSMEQAAAAISSAKAAISQAKLNLGYCTVTAPISGYISGAALDLQSYVGGEGSPVTLATIYGTDTMSAIFNISDQEYEKLIASNGGAKAPIYRNIPLTFSEKLPHRYSADLNYEAPNVDASTGTLLLKGDVANKNNELKDGMYVTVSLPYGENPHAILVKDASISTDQLGPYLYVVNDSNRLVYTPIKTGELFRDSLRIVTEGIRPGQKYVTKALLTARDGMTVKPRLTR